MAWDDIAEEYRRDLDDILDEHLRYYLAKAHTAPDSLDSSRWGQNIAKLFGMIEARAGRGDHAGTIGALAEQAIMPDDPDAQVGAVVERFGRDEVLRVISEDVSREAADDGT